MTPRIWVGLGVIAGHSMIALWILRAPAVRPFPLASLRAEPVLYVSQLAGGSSSSKTLALLLDAPRPEFVPPSLVEPTPPSMPSTFVPADLVDANPVDVAQAARICGAFRGARSRSVDSTDALVLRARVEPDGRVSAVYIDGNTPESAAWAGLQHCLVADASFSAHYIEGEPVASWQRIHWSAAAAGTPF